MRFNPRLGALRTADDFDAIMAALNLPRPAQIDVAVPANMWDGDATRAAAMPAGPAEAVMEAGLGLPSQCKRCADAIEKGKADAAAAAAAAGAAAP